MRVASMSRGRGGMQTNVALALGYMAPSRTAPESISCQHCGTSLEFDTDAIGRLLERCPRGCSSRRVSPDAASVDALQARLALNAANGAKRKKITQPKFAPRICELVACAKEYAPRSGFQRYCSPACAGAANKAGRGLSLGAAGRSGRREQ